MRAWEFGKIEVRHGTPARREIDFYYEDGVTPRDDLAPFDCFLRVYTTSAGTDLLFPEVKLTVGATPTQRVVSLTAAQCSQAGENYYAEIEFRDGAGPVTDGGWFGKFSVVGK